MKEIRSNQKKIMDGWNIRSLEEVSSDISYGYTASASFMPNGPKFLRITDIQGDHVDWESVPYCQISTEERKKYQLEKGDVCIARTGASTGTNYTIKEDVDAVFASYLIRYKIDKTIADPFYIGFLLRSPMWKTHVASVIGGSAQPGANAKQFAAFKFPLPSLLVQKNVVKILSDLDNKIELNHQMNKTLEVIGQALFKQWFVDCEGSDTKGWIRGCIGDLATLGRNSINPSQYQDEIFDHYSIPAFDEQRLPKPEPGSAIQSNKTVVPQNAVLLSKLNPRIPRIWLPNVKDEHRAICSTEFLVAIPKPDVSREFLYCLFSSPEFLDRFSVLVTGTSSSHQRVKAGDLLATEVTVPPSKVLLQFSEIMRSSFSQVLENLEETLVLSQLRDSLLPKLMSGKVRVSIGG